MYGLNNQRKKRKRDKKKPREYHEKGEETEEVVPQLVYSIMQASLKRCY